MKIIKRNGSEAAFDITKIIAAVTKANNADGQSRELTGEQIRAIAAEVEERLRAVHKPVTVAVMGCVVNGPGEAKEADIGIAGGDGKAVLFKKGQIVRTVEESCAVEELMRELETL